MPFLFWMELGLRIHLTKHVHQKEECGERNRRASHLVAPEKGVRKEQADVCSKINGCYYVQKRCDCV